MSTDDRLQSYVDHVSDGGDPATLGTDGVETDDRDIWVSWRTDDGHTRLEISVDGERYGYFVDGERATPSWEGGVSVPDVGEWEAVRQL
jgi:hypothetical protein